MKVIVDVMSGDNAPDALVQGAILAAEEYGVSIVMTGDEEIIRKVAADHSLSLEKVEIVHSDTVITMEDPALSVIQDKNFSSMSVGLKLLADGKGDAFVSAGNTGALLAGSTLIIRRIKGIRRAAIATVLPLQKPLLLLDAGANLAVTAEYLEQFAYMGAIYMEKVVGVKEPEVGLLNNGTEPTKGTPLLVETYQRLSQSELHFIGNVEGKDIPLGKCDVLVADGFTGNIVLKMTEGFGSFMMKKMKDIFFQNIVTKLSAILVKKYVKQLKQSFDASEYGGAPFLGISKPVIKAHGSSDAKAIKNAIRQAIDYVNNGTISEIAKFAARFTPAEKEQEKEK